MSAPEHFAHDDFRHIPYHEFPMGRDCFIIKEEQLPHVEAEWLKIVKNSDGEAGDPDSNTIVIWASVDAIHDDYLEIDIAINTTSRYHGVTIKLPKEYVLYMIDIWNWEKRPYIFVKDEWWDYLKKTIFSSFLYVDVIGFKKLLPHAQALGPKLQKLKEKIDYLTKQHNNALFISLADSLIVKTNWRIRGDEHERYNPEGMLSLFKELQRIYKEVLNCEIYGVLTQGLNDVGSSELVHVSENKRHIMLNALGTPFAHIFDIDKAARRNIKSGKHKPCSLYFTPNFFRSLKRKFGEGGEIKSSEYTFESPITPGVPSAYLCADIEELEKVIEPNKSNAPLK